MTTSNDNTYYISITGLVLKSAFHKPQFYYHAIPSVIQAKSAPGNLHTSVHRFHGHEMTMTIWENKKAMMAYMRSGAHVQAMKVFDDVASSGMIYGYETNSPEPIPWPEAFQILETKAKGHGGRAKANNKNNAHATTTDVASARDSKAVSSIPSSTSKSSQHHHLLSSLLLVAFALLCAAALKMNEKHGILDKIAAKAIF
jgi:hypothetical protein